MVKTQEFLYFCALTHFVGRAAITMLSHCLNTKLNDNCVFNHLVFGGGNGGPGGDVYVRSVRDTNILARYKATKIFQARNGDAGQNFGMQGKAGEDCYIELPIGSIIKNLSTGRTIELFNDGEEQKILHGGRGGLGNEYFKASTNIRPEQSTGGMQGEEADFKVELNLIADAGLVGLPNAGKSSLLNALTEAKAKVGNYQFTTLDPNLGALKGGFIIADLPGLIEGAASGKGLGHKFLKHIKRTKMILHLISLENTDIIGVYKSIRKELEEYGNGLDKKEEVIVLTKTDLVSKETIDLARKDLSPLNSNILEVSIIDDQAVKNIADYLTKTLS
jgi:GTP-binding protein